LRKVSPSSAAASQSSSRPLQSSAAAGFADARVSSQSVLFGALPATAAQELCAVAATAP
jgi:hypothetical protein